MLSIQVQHADFSIDAEYRALAADPGAGAIVFFVGLVRDHNLGSTVTALELEHYPGMTEQSLTAICTEAQSRWPLQAIRLVHRVGKLSLNEQIVFVGVSAAHRQAAFDGAAFIMDYLKTEAPFWKKEHTPAGAQWLDARESDQQARARWQNNPNGQFR